MCLSLLGTWSGPSWVPGESTILQVWPLGWKTSRRMPLSPACPHCPHALVARRRMPSHISILHALTITHACRCPCAQVLVSIQSMILVEDPYFNEPVCFSIVFKGFLPIIALPRQLARQVTPVHPVVTMGVRCCTPGTFSPSKRVWPPLSRVWPHCLHVLSSIFSGMPLHIRGTRAAGARRRARQRLRSTTPPSSAPPHNMPSWMHWRGPTPHLLT